MCAVNQRESFEHFAAGGYQTVENEILRLLDAYQEREALAILSAARAKIELRDAWITRSNPVCKFVKQDRG